MKKAKQALLGLGTALFLALPSAAVPGERVDFTGTVTGVDRNRIQVQSSDGRLWTVRTNNGRWRNRIYNQGFRIGDQVRITGREQNNGRILASNIQGGYAWNNNSGYYYPNQNQGYYNPNVPYQAPYYNNQVFTVTNPPSGAYVPQNFNIQGTGTPYTQVRVVVQTQRALIPGLINLPGQSWQGTAQVDQYGRFDIPVSANVPSGSRIVVQVTPLFQNGQQGSPTTIELIRQ